MCVCVCVCVCVSNTPSPYILVVAGRGLLQHTRVALVEDDEAFRAALAERLTLAELDVMPFASAEAALKVLRPDFDGVVVSDLRMPGMDGRQLADRLIAMDPDLPVVLMTGHGGVTEAVEAMKRGAYDFLTKPFGSERLIETLGREIRAKVRE